MCFCSTKNNRKNKKIKIVKNVLIVTSDFLRHTTVAHPRLLFHFRIRLGVDESLSPPVQGFLLSAVRWSL